MLNLIDKLKDNFLTIQEDMFSKKKSDYTVLKKMHKEHKKNTLKRREVLRKIISKEEDCRTSLDNHIRGCNICQSVGARPYINLSFTEGKLCPTGNMLFQDLKFIESKKGI